MRGHKVGWIKKKRRPLYIAELFDDSIIALTNQSKVTAHAQC